MKLIGFSLLLILISNLNVNACLLDANTNNAGSLTPTTTAQTISVRNGDYFEFEALSNCDTYTFTFCDNGAIGLFDTQLTILDPTGVTEFDSDNSACGINAEINFKPSVTGTYIVLISEFNCNHSLLQNADMAYYKTVTTPTNHNGYSLNNNATVQNIGGVDCIELTPSVNWRNGCAWNQAKINFASSFTIETDMYFGANLNAADGTTITFQNYGECDCGIAGGELGAGGISPAVVVEFDVYNNGGPYGDIGQDHVAIDVSGSLIDNSVLSGPIEAIPGGANIDDGNTHNVRVEWDEPTTTMRVFFDNLLRLTLVNDIVNTVFNGNSNVNWGFTAATGGANNQQYFCPPTTTFLPVELTSFTVNCKDELIYDLNWTTASEKDASHYRIEKTIDGMLFQNIGEVKANGNTNVSSFYNFQYRKLDYFDTYFRIVQVDFDGKESVSDLVLSVCDLEPEIIYTMNNPTQLFLSEKASKPYSISVYDYSGKLQTKFSVAPNSDKFTSYNLPNLSAGIYIVKLTDGNNYNKSSKIVIP